MCIDTRKPSKLAVSVAAIVTMSLALPAIAQQAAPAPGTFLGAVLISDDASAASEFYAAIFGWDMEQAKDGGFAVRHKGQMIAGISPIDTSDGEVEESFWLVGITVEDMDASLNSAKTNSAKIYEDAHRISDYGRFAVIADRQTAPVLLIEPGVKPLGRGRGHGSWLWAELWTNDVEDAAAFYADVVGVDHEITDRGGQDYHLFSSEGEPRTGIIKIPQELETLEPGWAPYVAVSDLGTTLGKVKELGGRVVFGDIEHPANASVALILDPSGAALFLYQIGSSGEAK
jgi:predicted enzyme related to lactoylglutathione lyase